MQDDYPEEGDLVVIHDPVRGGDFKATVIAATSEQCVSAESAEVLTKSGEPFVYRDVFRTHSDPQRCTWSFA